MTDNTVALALLLMGFSLLAWIIWFVLTQPGEVVDEPPILDTRGPDDR